MKIGENSSRKDTNKKEFINEIVDYGSDIFEKKELETLRACIQCGTCSGSCPSGRTTSFRTRKIFRLSQLNLKNEIINSDDLWVCTTCYTCQERCPRNVKTTDLIRIIRNLAVKNGNIHKNHQAVSGYLIKTGHAVPINEETQKLRKTLHLKELPPTTHSFKISLLEVQQIVKKTGFTELVNFSEEKEK
jgi:heterodisulfide reductase subunit C